MAQCNKLNNTIELQLHALNFSSYSYCYCYYFTPPLYSTGWPLLWQAFQWKSKRLMRTQTKKEKRKMQNKGVTAGAELRELRRGECSMLGLV